MNTKRRKITGSHLKKKKKGGESEDNEWYLEGREEEDFKEWEVTHAQRWQCTSAKACQEPTSS